MLPSQSKQKAYIHSDPFEPIGDGMLSRADTVDVLGGMVNMKHASAPLVAQTMGDYWRVEISAGGHRTEYCLVGTHDCGKSCAVVDCARNNDKVVEE